MQRLIVAPPRNAYLQGTVPMPASKYHAHRALILGSLAEGESHIEGRSGALHVRATLAALRRLGTRIAKESNGYRVWGGPYRPSQTHIGVGSSGSTLQFLLGLGCHSVGPALVFDGQKYLHHRPIGPLLDGLRALGVRLDPTGDRLPVTVYPGRPSGGNVRMPGTLSQWISGLLLLAPLASADTEIEVAGEINERPYLDLTLRMMADFGVAVDAADDYRRFRVRAGQRYCPADVLLPADLSSAAFGLVAAALLPADVTFANMDGDPDHPEKEILDILQRAGVPLEFDPARRTARIANPDGRRPEGVRIDCRDTPDLLPILCVLGACSRGDTVLDHVGHARLKESDRVKAMLQLRKMGACIEEEPDRLVIHGVERLRPATLSSFNDHRVMMAFAVAGSLCREAGTEISYPRAYRISYPEFLLHMQSMGLELDVRTVDAPEGAGPWSTTATHGSAPAVVSMMPAAWTERYRRSGLWPQRLVTDYLADAAAWTPDRAAVVDPSRGGRRVLTYGELADAVDRCATGLLGIGVRPGETVAFQLPNWWEFVVLQLALVRIGAVSCPLMPIFRERELGFMLGQSGCRLLVVPREFRGCDHVALARAVQRQVSTLRRVIVVGDDGPDGFNELLRQPADVAALGGHRPAADAITQLLYTSGTSGEPKGVLHTHNALLGATLAHIRHFGLTDRDTVYIPSPTAHQTGFLYGMWLAIVLGSTAIYQDIWDPARALVLFDEWRPGFVQAATPFLGDLCEAARQRGRPPAGLRLFVATGAPVPRVLAQMARSVLRCEVVGGWGTTESGLVSGGSPGDPPEKLWQTDGRVLAPMGMRVVDGAGRELPPGVEGRFQVWTPAMFVGYLGHPDWYRSAFTDEGWFDSGDLATIDAEGFMRITGRTKDVINRGGEKIPVAEVEELLYAHPAVAQAAVVGMPDPRLGERACAFVVLQAGAALSLQDVQRHLEASGTAKQYWPERLETVDSLPRTPSGKIQKFQLRQRIAELLASEAAGQVAPR